MQVNILQTPDEVIQKLAEDIVELARAAVSENRLFTMALSGGSSPKKLYQLLASEPLASKFPWSDTLFFFGDERYVPQDDPANNAKMAREAMLTAASVPENHILAVNTSVSPAEAAKQYEEQIKGHFTEPVFDLILLGLGDDSHTASLFPHTKVLAETEALVKEVKMLHDNSWRITMTRTLINHARHIFFLTYGKNKAIAVHNVLEGERYEFQFPAQFIDPTAGELRWYIDVEAASRLERTRYA